MKPMLAGSAEGELRFPCLVSPKLDGVRCLIIDGVAMSRSLKPIPNEHVQKLFGKAEYNGLDGELIVGNATDDEVFQRTSSGVMSIKGEPNVFFHVFDDFIASGGFRARFNGLKSRCKGNKQLQVVQHDLIDSMESLLELEAELLALGYEGAMLRDPAGQYKYGRSTTKEGWLLKLKRFSDSEAEVIGFTQLMSNANEAKTNELGAKARSHKKAGMVPKELIGALQVRDVKTGIEFEIGSGFTELERRSFWIGRHDLIGKLVKYKSQPVGVKDKPRFPVFLGFRDKVDM